MFYVYLLRSQSVPEKVYTGFTEDLRKRLAEHNAGKSTHTKKFTPWILETYLAFSDRDQALALSDTSRRPQELRLQGSGSGLHRHRKEVKKVFGSSQGEIGSGA